MVALDNQTSVFKESKIGGLGNSSGLFVDDKRIVRCE